ncbi:hypothetical protein M5689_018947 [Euphorbia peplus]|nr:hypothetical protein M5689_018947 [Euphorbia peplus]
MRTRANMVKIEAKEFGKKKTKTVVPATDPKLVKKLSTFADPEHQRNFDEYSKMNFGAMRTMCWHVLKTL